MSKIELPTGTVSAVFNSGSKQTRSVFVTIKHCFNRPTNTNRVYIEVMPTPENTLGPGNVAIMQSLRNQKDALTLTISGLSGYQLEVEEWTIDVADPETVKAVHAEREATEDSSVCKLTCIMLPL